MSRRVSWPHNNASLNTSFLVYRVTCNTITITSASDRSLSLKVRSHRLRRAAQCRMAPQRNAHQRTAAQLIRCERTFSSCSGLRISWARESPVARMTLVFYVVISTTTLCIRLYVHWYCHVWITVTVCLPTAHSLHSTVCSACKTPLLDPSVVLPPGRMHYLSWSSSTGCQCRAEFSSNCVL